MPCTYDGPGEESILLGELEVVTRMLCASCKLLTTAQRMEVEGLPSWWKEHQELDRLRLAREAERKKRIEARESAVVVAA